MLLDPVGTTVDKHATVHKMNLEKCASNIYIQFFWNLSSYVACEHVNRFLSQNLCAMNTPRES